MSEEKKAEPLDDENEPLTLETAIARLNANADMMAEMATQLRRVRRDYDELKVLLAIAHVFIDELRCQLASRCGRTHLTDAAKGFVESVDIPNLHKGR